MATITGTDGNDTLESYNAGDTILGLSGDDTLIGRSGFVYLFGGSGDDGLFGSDEDDTLFGGNGNDGLNGGLVSWMEGGAGDDRFRVDTADAVVRETAAGGFDQLFSEADTYVLPGGPFGYIERAIVSSDFIEGVPDGELRGNAYDNILVGSHLGNNRLIGKSGADTLNGQSGRDFMIGGSGDDTFIVDDQGDKVRDRTGGGVDLVRTEVSFTLPSGSGNAFIENLTLRAIAGDIDGAGNSLDNSIQGNAKSNELYGLSGDDILRAGKDRDQLFGGEGNDRLLGQAGDDTLWMQTGNLAFGGLDEDQFRFAGDILGEAGSGGTRIRDFNGVSLNAGNGEDKLVFDTGLETGTFAYIGGAAFSGGGNSEARFDGERRLEIDQDGDGTADIGLEIQKLTAADQLTATDFVWLA
ncbi:MAG: hypothetical protein Kilf2KO_45860 [Rhodospirillales bacterium]